MQIRKDRLIRILIFLLFSVSLYFFITGKSNLENFNVDLLRIHNSKTPFLFEAGNDIGWQFLVSFTVSALRSLSLSVTVTHNTVDWTLFGFAVLNAFLVLKSDLSIKMCSSVLLAVFLFFLFGVEYSGGSVRYGSFSNRNFSTWACINVFFIISYIYTFRYSLGSKFSYIVFFSFFLSYFIFLRSDSAAFILFPALSLMFLSFLLFLQSFRNKIRFKLALNIFLSACIMLSAGFVERFLVNQFLKTANGVISAENTASNHGVWFPVYLGILSYHSNPYNLSFDDDVGYLHQNLYWDKIFDPNDKSVLAYDNRFKKLFFRIVLKNPALILRNVYEKFLKLNDFLVHQEITVREKLFYVDTPSNVFLKYLYFCTFPAMFFGVYMFLRKRDYDSDIYLMPLLSVLAASLIVPLIIWPGYVSSVYGFLFSVCFIFLPYSVFRK